MKNIIHNLVKVANYLDAEEMYEESNFITKIAAKLAETMNDMDDEDLDMDDEDLDMDDEDLDMDDEDLDDEDNMQELADLLEELGVSEEEKLEIIEMVKKDTADVEEFAFEAPTMEDEEMATDDMLAKSDEMAAQEQDLEDMDYEEEQAAADEAMISETGYEDIKSLLKDDPELLAWYESLGTD